MLSERASTVPPGGSKSFEFDAGTGTCRLTSSSAGHQAKTAGAYEREQDQEVTDVQLSPDWFREAFTQVGNRLFRIIQQRFKGELSFARNWTEYENGFGDDTDFWLGLKTISNLTANNASRLLRVEATNWSGVLYVSEYSGFFVSANPVYKYWMMYASYMASSSNATSDSLAASIYSSFSTYDKDNSVNSACSQSGGRAGWWYQDCSDCNPNGLYYNSTAVVGGKTMFWLGAGQPKASLKSIRLMLLAN